MSSSPRHSPTCLDLFPWRGSTGLQFHISVEEEIPVFFSEDAVEPIQLHRSTARSLVSDAHILG